MTDSVNNYRSIEDRAESAFTASPRELMAEPLVSIIMPAFNAEKYIAESIGSVLRQTYRHWELIIIDDGSSDRTAEIARGFSASDGRIRCISQRNSGQGKARNTGLRSSAGELIAFLDSDDLWESEKLRLQGRIMEETEADVVFSNGIIFSQDDVMTEIMAFTEAVPGMLFGPLPGDIILRHLPAGNFIPMLSVMARKSVLSKVNNFDARRRYQNCEDYDLWLRLASAGASFFGMREKLVRYRRHPDAATTSLIKVFIGELAVLKKHARNKSAYRHATNNLRDGSDQWDVVRERIATRRELIFRAYMDQFSLAIDSGRLTSALPFLWKAARLSPAKVWQQRWLIRTIGNSILQAIKDGPRRRKNRLTSPGPRISR